MKLTICRPPTTYLIKKKKKCRFYAECRNNAVKGGVCLRHGAKKKKCSYPECPNIVQRSGVCCKHGAKVKTCSHPDCSSNAVKSGLCRKHGVGTKKCAHPGCTNNSIKDGACMRHGSINKTRDLAETKKNLKTPDGGKEKFDSAEAVNNHNATSETLNPVSPRLYPIDELLYATQTTKINEGQNNIPHQVIMGLERENDDVKISRQEIRQNPLGREDIGIDIILQIPYTVSSKFRKVGFTMGSNGKLLPALALGPNDLPSNSDLRSEWLKKLKQHLRHGAPMVHVVYLFGSLEETERFGLVNDFYLYDEALENEFRLNPEREIHAKVLNGDALSERDLKFNLAVAELHIARNIPEEYRWAWKTISFSF